METLIQDLRFALRGLSRNPGFSGVAMASLGLPGLSGFDPSQFTLGRQYGGLELVGNLAKPLIASPEGLPLVWAGNMTLSNPEVRGANRYFTLCPGPDVTVEIQ